MYKTKSRKREVQMRLDSLKLSQMPCGCGGVRSPVQICVLMGLTFRLAALSFNRLRWVNSRSCVSDAAVWEV